LIVKGEFEKGPASEADLDAARPLKSLFKMAQRRRGLFLSILALAGFSSLLLLVQPLLYREAVNDVAGVFVKNSWDDGFFEKDERTLVEAWKSKVPHTRHIVAHRTPKQAMATLIVVVVLLLLISLLASFTSAWAEILTSRAGHGMERAVILAVFRKALHLPLSRDSADRASYLTKQVDQMEQVEPVVTMLALRVGPEVISLVGILAIMLSQSRLLAVVALAPLPLYVWVAVASTKKLGVNLDSYYQQWQSISGRISESLAGLKTVRASGATDRELTALEKETYRAYSKAVAKDRLGAWALFGQDFFVQVSKALVLLVGGWKAFEKQLTPGDVVMLVAYIDQLYNPLDSLSGMVVIIQEHISSFRRGLRLAVRKPENFGTISLKPGPGLVSVEGLDYRYSHGASVLHELSFSLLPGKLNALVGPSGSGKSTLAELILGLRPATQGKIYLDGQNIHDLSEEDLRRTTSLVSADGVLFSATLKENLCYQVPDASERQAWEALKAACLDDVVKRLPHGLETFLVDGHGPLSLGERQRLQIARAMLAKPRLLVLDEATANLDKENEARILKVLQDLKGHCTVLALTHHPALARGADQVIVLVKGRIGAVGKPATIARTNAYYKGMMKS
jgi:ABC-type multidrug transport system fused ATPase/permease subunit